MLALLLEPNGDLANVCNMLEINIPVRVNEIMIDFFITKLCKS